MGLRIFCVALSAVLVAGAVRAETASEPPPPAAAPRAKVISVGTPVAAAAAAPAQSRVDTVRLSFNKTQEVILPAPIRDVVVGSPDVVDVLVRTPTQVMLVGRGVGQSDVTFFDRSGKVLRRMGVDVHLDADALREVLRQVLPDETNIRVSGVGDSLYLSGTVRNDGAAAQARALARRFVKDDANVVTLLKVSAEQQVLLQVKVAEMQKTVLKELGVGLTTSLAGGLPNKLSTSVTTSGTVGLTQSSALFGTVALSGIDSIVATFSALERQGLIRTLVEPNLTAVSGETANMLAGGEFPIPVSEQNNTVTLEFKPFGVLLNFTPVVLDPGRISLKLQTEVSAIDKVTAPVKVTNFEIPGLTVRRASSTVEMASGGSIMIAGLLQNDITSTLSGMPGIMDVPILGALFKSSSFQRKETELVVIVSAYVVEPLKKPQFALPSDGFVPSSDLDRLLMNRLQETYTRPGTTAAVPAQLQGPIGYIVQ